MESKDKTLLTVSRWKAISHPLRLAIVRELSSGPKTNQELADTLEVEAGRLHFHTRKLLASGYVKIESEIKVRNVVQKKYSLISSELIVPVRQDGQAPPLLHFLLSACELYEATWREMDGNSFLQVGFHQVYYQTEEKRKEFYNRLQDLHKEFRDSAVEPTEPGAELMTFSALSHEVLKQYIPEGPEPTKYVDDSTAE